MVNCADDECPPKCKLPDTGSAADYWTIYMQKCYDCTKVLCDNKKVDDQPGFTKCVDDINQLYQKDGSQFKAPSNISAMAPGSGNSDAVCDDLDFQCGKYIACTNTQAGGTPAS